MSRYKSAKTGRFEPDHGMYKSAIYGIWQGMKGRCNRPTCNGYERYGGRGISYCDKWSAFQGFFEDMGDSFEEGLSLDRLDNDLDYCKDNCKWSTIKEQALNKTTNVKVTIDGVTLCLSQWRDLYGLTNSMVYKRNDRGELGYHLIRPSGVVIKEGSSYNLVKPSKLIKESRFERNTLQ